MFVSKRHASAQLMVFQLPLDYFVFDSEIDKNIDYMLNLRRDKWMVEGKLRK